MNDKIAMFGVLGHHELTKIGSSKFRNNTASTSTVGLPFVRFLIITSIFMMSLFTSCSIFWNIIFCAQTKTIQRQSVSQGSYTTNECCRPSQLLTFALLGLAVAAAETVAIIRSLMTINAQQMVQLNKIPLNPNPYMLFYQFRTFRELNLIKWLNRWFGGSARNAINRFSFSFSWLWYDCVLCVVATSVGSSLNRPTCTACWASATKTEILRWTSLLLREKNVMSESQNDWYT